MCVCACEYVVEEDSWPADWLYRLDVDVWEVSECVLDGMDECKRKNNKRKKGFALFAYVTAFLSSTEQNGQK